MKDENLFLVLDNALGVKSLPKSRDNHPGIVQPHLCEQYWEKFNTSTITQDVYNYNYDLIQVSKCISEKAESLVQI